MGQNSGDRAGKWLWFLTPAGAIIAALIGVVFGGPIIKVILSPSGTPFASPAVTRTPPDMQPPSTRVPTTRVIPENFNIVCLNCGGNYALTLEVNTITIDYATRQTTMKYTITNSGKVTCNVQISQLDFQDESGIVFKAQNEGQSIGYIAVGNPYILNSKFDLLPQPNIHYLLNISLTCGNPLEYKTQDLVFN